MSVIDGEDSHVDFAGIDALLSRAPGYSVAAKCLEVQNAAEALNPSLRTGNKVTLADDAWSWYTGAIGDIAVDRRGDERRRPPRNRSRWHLCY